MRASPTGLQSDLLGRPAGLRRIHLIDSSVFPSIPPTTITYTVMANAQRIAAQFDQLAGLQPLFPRPPGGAGYDARRLDPHQSTIRPSGTAAAKVGQVSEQSTSTPKLPALTGVRILAALAVYASHIGPPVGSPAFLAAFFSSGYAGVTVFFVLSGFVLAVNYFERFSHLNPRVGYDYFVARIARIYPLYILILFYFVVRQHAFGASIDGWWRNTLAIQAWDPNLAHAYSFDGPSWSISVEFFLYACFPLLVPLLGRLRNPRGVVLAAAGVAISMAGLAALFTFTGRAGLPWEDPGSAHRWLYRMPLTRLGDFTLGMLGALLYAQTRKSKAIERAGAPLTIGAMVAVLALMAWPALLFTGWSWDVAYAIPAAIFIFGLAAAPASLPARVLSLPFLVLLGEASYAFYLVHAPGIDFLGGGQWANSISATTIVLEALTLGAILALAVGLHITFEGPARTYLRRALSLGKKQRRSGDAPA